MRKRIFIAATIIGVFIVAFGWKAVTAFNPQPDPPGFGLVGILPDQTIRLNVVCYEHPIGEAPPDPCRGELMFHNAAGGVLAHRFVSLKPGESAFLDFSIPAGVGGDEIELAVPRLSINPCILPAPDSGRMLPSAEVVDNATGHTTLYLNVATPRLSFVDGPRGRINKTSTVDQ